MNDLTHLQYRRNHYGLWRGVVQRSLKVVPKARESLGCPSDADDEYDDDDLAPCSFQPTGLSKLNIMDPNTSPPKPGAPDSDSGRRRAISITDRVNTIVPFRRGSRPATGRSRPRANSDLSNGARTGVSSLGIFTRSATNSREHSACTTEDDRESSEEFHSVADSSEFGLLEDDPFANLNAPPSECHSPYSRLWIRSLSSEVIREEPEETFEKDAKRMSMLKRTGSPEPLNLKLVEPEKDTHENDGDVSVLTYDNDDQRSLSGDDQRRKRSSSLTQRVRDIVQSRPSLPSLSILATTKIFVPASKSAMASRFPSEPWDDPKYGADPYKHVRTVPSQKGNNHPGAYGEGDQYRRFYEDSEDGGRYPSRDPYRARGGGDGGPGGNGNNGNQPPNRSGGNSRSTSEDHTTEERTTSTSSDDSDDLPLGQRPNALKAQKSLRMKIKGERRSRKETIKPIASAATGEFAFPPKSQKEPAVAKLSADDLTARLLRLREDTPPVLHSPTGRTAFPTLPVQSTSRATSPSSRSHPHSPPHSPLHGHFHFFNSPPHPSKNKELPPIPTFHPSGFAFPSLSSSAPPLKRHAADAHLHHAAESKPHIPERSMASLGAHRAPFEEPNENESRRPSLSYDPKPQPPSKRARADTLIQKIKSPGIPAVLRNRANSLHSKAAPPPLPPLPLPVMSNQANSRSAPLLGEEYQGSGSSTTMQQRIFIRDLQRYTDIDIDSRTNAREVLTKVEAAGGLSAEEIQRGEWMLFEMANDFGMERPIREYEIVMEIYNSWNSDTRVNYFMLKRTPLASVLAAEAIPKSSPTHGGYIEWEHKRGKWTKRWLELREHSLWLSKRQGAKDATVLCTLSNFDVYLVTRPHKSPKPFVFSIKSVQNMHLFERVQDYHHVLCCDMNEGGSWLRDILLARSCVLHQERTALFRQLEAMSSTSRNPSHPTASLPVSHSTARRAPNALLNLEHSSMPAPLAFPPQSHSAAMGSETFQPEPGSLLAKRL